MTIATVPRPPATPEERLIERPQVQSGGNATDAVRLEGVRKLFGDVVAVASVDLGIARGEFFSLLGPSRTRRST